MKRSKCASTVLDLAARWRSIAINGTRPEPSATSGSTTSPAYPHEIAARIELHRRETAAAGAR